MVFATCLFYLIQAIEEEVGEQQARFRNEHTSVALKSVLRVNEAYGLVAVFMLC